MLTFYSFLALLGRCMLVTIFLMAAIGQKIPKFSDVAAYMEAEGVPAPKIMLGGAIAFLIVGSISVAIGFKARIGAGLLMVFLILATYYFHDFWTIINQDAVAQQAKQEQMIQFMKNLSMAGAMLLIVGNGAGTMSVDSRLRSRKGP